MANLPTCLLVADIGAVATKVGLIDRVAGEYRVIGATRTLTTDGSPYVDVSLGLRQGIMQLEVLTGRRLLDDKGELIRPLRADGDGVDAVAAVTSAAPPLHTVVIGLSRDFSVASAVRALSGTYAIVEHTIAVDEESGRWGTMASDGRAGGPSAAVEKLAMLKPDLVVMVGGIEGGAVAPLREMANIVAAVGAAMDESQRPLVIFAGNSQARTDVIERLGGWMEVRVVDNVLPMLDRPTPAPLQAEIETIYRTRQMAYVPGLDKVAALTEKGLMTAADSFTRTVQYLARKYRLRVLALDLGAATTALIRADASSLISVPRAATSAHPTGGDGRDGTTAADAVEDAGTLQRILVAEVNLGYGLDPLLVQKGIETIAQWLPTSYELPPAHATLLNQAIRPWITPTDSEQMTVLNAAGREVLAHARRVWRGNYASDDLDCDLVLLSGAPIARGSRANGLILMLLDALELRGIFSVAADGMGLATTMGALAAVNPDAAAQALENDCLVTWGTVFVPHLPVRLGEGPAMRVKLEPAQGGELEVEVKPGSLELLPLGEGEKANVEIQMRRGVTLDSSRRGTFRREVQGGTIGLLIDARGRPLPFADQPERRRERMQQWLWEAGA